MRWPLKNQILIPLVGLMLLTIILVSCTSAYLADRREKQRIESRLKNVMSTLKQSRFPLNTNVLNQMKRLSGADFVVRNPANEVINSTCDLTAVNSVSEKLGEFPLSDISLENRISVADETFFHASVALDKNTSKPLNIDILLPEKEYLEAWQQAVMPPLAIGFIVFVLSVVAAVFLATRLTRPIEKLRARVERIAEGDFHSGRNSSESEVSTLTTRDDEIRDLSNAVDHMAHMLTQYEGQVRRHEQLRTLGQLGGGIAHQLRNSVTGCRLAMDIHQRECKSADYESLQVALRQLGMIEEYLTRFLSLGQTQEDEFTQVELNQLVRDALELIAPSAAHAKVEIKGDLDQSPIHLNGSPTSLSQMLMNLLLNAIDATTHFASSNPDADMLILVTMKRDLDNSKAIIKVSDPGAGPDPAVKDQIFEPLVTEKPSGVGLGLSVVKNVAEQHDGTVNWHRMNERTCFVVELPCLPK